MIVLLLQFVCDALCFNCQGGRPTLGLQSLVSLWLISPLPFTVLSKVVPLFPIRGVSHRCVQSHREQKYKKRVELSPQGIQVGTGRDESERKESVEVHIFTHGK